MGPIKIHIKTDTSEYGGDSDQVPDVTQRVRETEPQEISDQKLTGDDKQQTEAVYDYEGEDCFYTEPGSGARYKWSKETSAWINTVTGESRGSGEAATPGTESGQNYKMEDGTYVYVDRLTNKKHKWNLETTEWDVVENNDEPEEEEESEEDENMSEADRRARQYRKRKAAPGWDQIKYQKVCTAHTFFLKIYELGKISRHRKASLSSMSTFFHFICYVLHRLLYQLLCTSVFVGYLWTSHKN